MDNKQLPMNYEQSRTNPWKTRKRNPKEFFTLRTPTPNGEADGDKPQAFYEIALTNGGVAIVDVQDYDACSKYFWWRSPFGYAVTRIKGAPNRNWVQLHRIIMGHNGVMDIDHANRNKLDCRRTNLRWATRSQNCANCKKYKNGKTSQFKGISKSHNCRRWVAQIQWKNKKYYIGLFRTQQSAAKAYNERAKSLFGEFANLNQL